MRGLNALVATISTPIAAPVVAATRLRGGNANSARGAAGFAAHSVTTARAAGCAGTIVVRMDSAYYGAAVAGAIRRAGARFSVTALMDPKVRAAIASIGQDAWTPIKYPRALWDGQLRAWVSEAEVAEAAYTAFTSKKGQAITARLIVRRVKDRNRAAGQGQAGLFPVWRYHAVFTDSPFTMLQAEEQHRDHAIVEQVFADWASGPRGAPSLRLVCRERGLGRVRGHGAQPAARRRVAGQPRLRQSPRRHAAPRPHRRRRPHRHGRGEITLHLPEGWHRGHDWTNMFDAACRPPAAAA